MIRAALVALVVLAGPAQALEPVRGFEVERYLGTWHQIATIPAWFQRQCAYGAGALYTPAEKPGRVGVLNSCRTEAGELDRVYGEARFIGATDVGALEVTFLRLFGAYRWFAAGEYLILALDPDYRWSAVGHPSLDFAWILARDTSLSPETLATIEAAYASAGYDTCRLILSAQRPGDFEQPLCQAVATR